MVKSMKAKALLLPLILLCAPHADLEARHKDRSNGLGTFLCWAGGAIVGGLIGTAIYNACQSPTDSDELCSGQQLLNDAQSLQAKFASRYQQDCSYLLGERPALDQLKYSIVHNGSRKTPFIQYTSKLSNNISSTQHMIHDLINKKNHLFERKMDLKRSSDKMSLSERASYSEQYENLIENITRNINTLQAMCNDLRHLETTIIGLPEYREEQLLTQINHLEDRLDNMNYHHHYWQPAVAHVELCPAQPAFTHVELYPAQPAPYYETSFVVNYVEPQPAPAAVSWGCEYTYSFS
jgi:hypothetical protein